MQDTPKTLISSLSNFLTGTLLSRITGLLREIVMAFSFGVSPAIASFWMAFRFANLFRRLFGEGGLNMAFIPHYEDLKKKDPSQASTFFMHLSQKLIYLLLAIVVFTEIILGLFLTYQQLTPETYEILKHTMILLPALLFLSLYALNSAFLNSEKSYFLPSAAPTVVNILWIIAALFFSYITPKKAIDYLAMSIVFAFAIQWLVTAIPAYRITSQFPIGQKIPLLPFLKPFFLTIIGVTAQQINGAIDSLFAKAADAEGPAILWYALRLQQLPFALIGVGLVNSLLPPLSRATDESHFQNLLNFSLKKVSTFMIPITFAILCGGFAGVNLLYGRGAFSLDATYETTYCLMGYGLALLPMGWTLLLASAFYAKKDYKTPTICAILAILINIGLNALFVYGFHWRSVSIALSTTSASVFNVILLGSFLCRIHKNFLSGIASNLIKIASASVFSFIMTALISHIVVQDTTLSFFLKNTLLPLSRRLDVQLLSMSIIAIIYGGTFLVSSYLFNVEEFKIFNIKKKLKKL